MKCWPSKKELQSSLDEAMTYADGQMHWEEGDHGVHYELKYEKDDIVWKMNVVVVNQDDAIVMKPFDDNHVPDNPVYNDSAHSEIWGGTIKHIKNLYSRAYQRFVVGRPKTKVAIKLEAYTKPATDEKDTYCPFSNRMICDDTGVNSITVIIRSGGHVIRNKAEENQAIKRSVYDYLFPLLRSNK